MSLKDLQENFQNYLCGVKNSITQLVVVDEKVPINIRLGIYKNAYEARLTECLSANYPKLLAYLGDEHFQNLAKKYIKAYPSNFHSIRWYGDSLAEFVADFYPQDLYLAELAEFEWKITLAFDAADDSRMSVNEMATIPPEHWGELRFKRHPSVQILSCQWNTPQLWQALTEDLPLPESSFTEEPTLWLVWRTTDYFIKFISLTSVEAIIWSQLAEGQCFSALCELLCTWYSPEQVGMHAASYLKGWIERGLLASITS